MGVLALRSRLGGGESVEHRSIIAQDTQELHSSGDRGFDVTSDDSLVGMVAEASGRA